MIYSSVSDPLPKSSVAYLGTDLDQIGSSSDSERTIATNYKYHSAVEKRIIGRRRNLRHGPEMVDSVQTKSTISRPAFSCSTAAS